MKRVLSAAVAFVTQFKYRGESRSVGSRSKHRGSASEVFLWSTGMGGHQYPQASDLRCVLLSETAA